MLERWNQWSRQSSKWKPGECKAKWATFKRDHPKPVTLANLAKWSQSETSLPPGGFKCTDLGNAERFVHLYADRVRYCPQVGSFLVWDGTRWKRDETLEVQRLGKATVRAIYHEAAATGEDGIRKAVAKHAQRSESRGAITAMLELAKAEITVSSDDLDVDPWLLSCVSGTIDLRTGKLREHRRDDLITKLAPVEYQRDATCPRWLSFLSQIFGEDGELVTYVQRWVGHCLSGCINEQILPVCYGPGANGKSTMLDAIVYVMGDYADHAPPELLVQRRHHDEHPTEVAGLMGLRLVVASESEKDRHLRVQMMKRLTGESTLRARFMKQDYFSFRRTFKTILVTNNRPKVDEDNEAVWRRLKLVPFSVVISRDEQDRGLPEKLRDEAPGILRWLVEGCLGWQRDGLKEPVSVESATSDYREDSDPFKDFLEDDCCILAPNAWASSAMLWREYERWCKDRGERPLKGRAYGDALRKHGCEVERRAAGHGWTGVGLLTAQEEVRA